MYDLSSPVTVYECTACQHKSLDSEISIQSRHVAQLLLEIRKWGMTDGPVFAQWWPKVGMVVRHQERDMAWHGVVSLLDRRWTIYTQPVSNYTVHACPHSDGASTDTLSKNSTDI